MFKMGCSMARKILPGSSSGNGGGGDGAAGQQAACFSLGGGQLSKSSGRTSENNNNNNNGNSQQNQDGGGGGQQSKRVANSSELGDFSKLEDDPRIPLNVRQIFKITKSWKAIARTMSKTGTAMFLNLFEQNQDLFYLFDRFQHLKGKELHESMELREHAATVMSTLDTSINSLSDYDNFVTYLHSIGELHRKVPGFKREYFWKIEQPFMKAVKQTLDERCNETIEEIYKIAIKLIIETIADGYGQDGQGDGDTGGPVTPNNERRDDNEPKNRGGEGGAGGGGGNGGDAAHPGGNNNNNHNNNNNNNNKPGGGGGGGKPSGFAMVPLFVVSSAWDRGQRPPRPHEVEQTKTTNACNAAARPPLAVDDFTKSSISRKKLKPTPPLSTRRKDNNGANDLLIISESQSEEEEEEEKVGGQEKNGVSDNKNKNKYLRAPRACCTIVRRNVLVLMKTKRVLSRHMQSQLASTFGRRKTNGRSNQDCERNQNYLEGTSRPVVAQEEKGEDQEHNEEKLDELVLSTCKLLETTTKLIEERVQSQSNKVDDDVQREEELAKLIKWRGLLTELTGGGSLTNVTGDVQDGNGLRETTTTTLTPPLEQTHQPMGHNGERFNIKSDTCSHSTEVAVSTGANDNNSLELVRCGRPKVADGGESAEQNYDSPLPLPTAEPASDLLLRIASCVTGGTQGISGQQHTAATTNKSTGAHSCCPYATPQGVVAPVDSTATDTCSANTTSTGGTRVGNDEAPAPGAQSAVPCERSADKVNLQTNTRIESTNSTGNTDADLIDFVKLLLGLNHLIRGSTSLTQNRTSNSNSSTGTIPTSRPTLTETNPQVGPSWC